MRRFVLFTLALFLGLSAATVSAQEADAAREQALESLECLIGTWSGEGELEMGEQTFTVQFDYTCRQAAGGAGVACHLVMTGIPDFTYEMDDLWGQDPGTGAIHWYTITNAGETHDHRGRIAHNAFIGSFIGRRDGKPMRENVRLQFQGRDRMVVSSVVFVARERVECLTVTLDRQAPQHAQASRR